MRVLLVHNSYRQAGGEDAVVAAERALLAGHGHEIDMFAASNDDLDGPGAILATAWRAPYSAAARDALARRLAAARPDVVHVHNFFPRLTPAIHDACRAAGVAVVQTLHNYRLICPAATLLRDGRVCELCVSGSAYRAVRYGCYRGSRRATLAVARMIETHRRRRTWHEKVDRFIALTEFAKGRFVAGGLPAARIAVKPNFAADEGAPGTGPRAGALYVGRLSEEKGARPLIAAWRRVETPLRVIGDGPLAAELRAAAPANVAFLGARDAEGVRAEMRRAAVLIVPSICYEGFPMVIAEAYCRGLPVIASRLGGLAEIVADGETGLLAAPGDSADLAATATRAAANPEALRALGAGARRRYLARYTPAANHDQLIAIYDAAMTAAGLTLDPGGGMLRS